MEVAGWGVVDGLPVEGAASRVGKRGCLACSVLPVEKVGVDSLPVEGDIDGLEWVIVAGLPVEGGSRLVRAMRRYGDHSTMIVNRGLPRLASCGSPVERAREAGLNGLLLMEI